MKEYTAQITISTTYEVSVNAVNEVSAEAYFDNISTIKIMEEGYNVDCHVNVDSIYERDSED